MDNQWTYILPACMYKYTYIPTMVYSELSLNNRYQLIMDSNGSYRWWITYKINLLASELEADLIPVSGRRTVPAGDGSFWDYVFPREMYVITGFDMIWLIYRRHSLVDVGQMIFGCCWISLFSLFFSVQNCSTIFGMRIAKFDGDLIGIL